MRNGRVALFLIATVSLLACVGAEEGSSESGSANTRDVRVVDMVGVEETVEDVTEEAEVEQEDAEGDSSEEVSESQDAEEDDVSEQGDALVTADAVSDPDLSRDPDAADDPDTYDEPDAASDTPEPLICSEIAAHANSERETVAECTRTTQCGLRRNPLCPVAGRTCVTYYRLGADMSRLDDLEALYLERACRDGACFCEEPPETRMCHIETGRCDACPERCPRVVSVCRSPYSNTCGCVQNFCDNDCDTLDALISRGVSDIAQGCRTAEDCRAVLNPLGPPFCTEVGCYLAVNNNASLSELESLGSSFRAAVCSEGLCLRCTDIVPRVTCTSVGVCVIQRIE
jgi:hypothetical protein